MRVFSATEAGRSLFQLYRARIEIRHRVLGGVPKDAELIESWLRTKAGISDQEELRNAWLRTLFELGVDVVDNMSFDEAVEASKRLAANKVTTGFKVDCDRGVYLESRQLKAGIRETINILYGGTRIGPTRKGARSYVAERVFVTPDRLFLDRAEPDGVELMVGHVNGPQGHHSVLSYHEYVQAPASLDFTVLVAEDSVPEEWWARIWTLFEQNGLGAVRSQGNGTFDLVQWDKLGVPTQEQFEAMIAADRVPLSRQPVAGRG
jgi:hypothetical protein